MASERCRIEHNRRPVSIESGSFFVLIRAAFVRRLDRRRQLQWPDLFIHADGQRHYYYLAVRRENEWRADEISIPMEGRNRGRVYFLG